MPDKPPPTTQVQVHFTEAQLEWMDKESLPWRLGLSIAAGLVLAAMVGLTLVQTWVTVTTTQTTTVTGTPSATASPTGSVSPDSSGSGSGTAGTSSSTVPASTPLDSPRASSASSITASPTASPSSTAQTNPALDSKAEVSTVNDNHRPSDTLLGSGYAVGLLLLLAAAFFNRATKLSGPGGISVETGEALVPDEKKAVESHAAGYTKDHGLSGQKAKVFKDHAEMVARVLKVDDGDLNAEDLATTAVAKTAELMDPEGR